MPTPQPVNAADMPHTILSAAAIATVLYLPVMRPGRVKDFFVTVGAAVTTADETFTLAYAPPGSTTFVNVADAVIVQPTSGSAAGTTVRQKTTIGTTVYVQDGGTFRITPSGGGGGGAPLVAGVIVGP